MFCFVSLYKQVHKKKKGGGGEIFIHLFHHLNNKYDRIIKRAFTKISTFTWITVVNHYVQCDVTSDSECCQWLQKRSRVSLRRAVREADQSHSSCQKDVHEPTIYSCIYSLTVLLGGIERNSAEGRCGRGGFLRHLVWSLPSHCALLWSKCVRFFHGFILCLFFVSFTL